jgi:hypothetical protein
MEPHPLFKSFIGAAYEYRQRRLQPGAESRDRAETTYTHGL